MEMDNCENCTAKEECLWCGNNQQCRKSSLIVGGGEAIHCTLDCTLSTTVEDKSSSGGGGGINAATAAAVAVPLGYVYE